MSDSIDTSNDQIEAIANDSRIPEDHQLFKRYWETGDPQDLEIVVQHYERLVFAIVGKYYKSTGSMSLDDLKQVGLMGLVLAAQRYDPSKNTRFSTFATHTVHGEIMRYFRDKQWVMSVPRRLKERSLKLTKVIDNLSKELARSPSIEELAAEMNLSAEAVLEALEICNAYQPTSIFEDTTDDVSMLQVDDKTSNTKLNHEQTILFEQLMKLLNRQEICIIQLYFINGMNQREISLELNVSQMYISRILKRALSKIRSRMKDVTIDWI